MLSKGGRGVGGTSTILRRALQTDTECSRCLRVSARAGHPGPPLRPAPGTEAHPPAREKCSFGPQAPQTRPALSLGFGTGRGRERGAVHQALRTTRPDRPCTGSQRAGSLSAQGSGAHPGGHSRCRRSDQTKGGQSWCPEAQCSVSETAHKGHKSHLVSEPNFRSPKDPEVVLLGRNTPLREDTGDTKEKATGALQLEGGGQGGHRAANHKTPRNQMEVTERHLQAEGGGWWETTP